MDKTSMAVAVFDKHAHEYEQRFMDVSLYDDTLNAFCDSLSKEDASILELGCGPGNITRYLLNKLPNLKILATDLSPNMLELAKKNNPEANFELLDCRDISKLSQKFDAVVCGFCLPYLSKEETLNLIKDIATVLNENGVFYLSTIEGNYSNSGLTTNSHGDSVYMYYYEEKYLKQAIEEHFKVMGTYHKHYNHNGSEVKDLILIAIKKS
ncbi:class I SAM-dependent DNA methyltransferase [Flavobacterium suzhouense]|uniref:Class I SAM-dependent DNA methyltransferase n=1 Tax=Flavobacterium suzhouense TaxID=1529638 RepID=A0ABW5NYU0_9FLAO